MRLSIQSKFTLALLATSLGAVLLMGQVARTLVLRDFNQIIQEDSVGRFRLSVTRYVKEYGTLENALRQERFPEFQARTEPRAGTPNAPPTPWSSFRGPDAFTAEPASAGAEGGGPGQPAGEFLSQPAGGPPGGPPSDFDGPPGEMPEAPGDWGGPGQPARQGARPEPPYRFMLLDAEGRLCGGESELAMGTLVPASVRRTALPVVVGGKVVAFVVPDAHPNLTRQDKAYLGAMSQALQYALVATVAVAVLFGALVGRRLGRDLGVLTAAVEAVGCGSLGQEVRIRSRDEVGVLAGAFNRMSAELVRARETLEHSAAQIQEQASRLQELSIRDGLTGLYNRRHFDERAAALYAQAQRYQQPLTLVVGDVDYFKRINDKYSHAVGDEVLRRVADLLRANTRESDLVARYGGEEFVIALTNTPAPQAAQACEKLRYAIESHPWHEVHPDLRVTMSLGLSDRVSLGGPEPMLGAADAQLYRAKEEGRNRVNWERPVAIPASAAETPAVLRQGQAG